MKTQDVTKTGIDRNFIRQCEKQGIITPSKNPSKWMRCEEYAAKEYTQSDVEKIWNAYLCRKIGLSYNQTKILLDGEDLPIRNSLNQKIEEYQKDIEEKLALIEFMKYVKGVGYIPSMPNELMGSENFKEYLIDFMNYFDSDKKIKSVLQVAEYIANSNSIDEIEEEKALEFKSMVMAVSPELTEELMNEFGKTILEIKESRHMKPGSQEVQALVKKFYKLHEFATNNDTNAWEFFLHYYNLVEEDSDLSEMYIKTVGKETLEFLDDALIEFILVEDPGRLQPITTKK